MSSIIFFLFFIPVLSVILLSVNFIFAPHKPYKEKKTPFECGYHSFSQTRSQFSISFFLFSYVFLLLDIEIILLYPFPLSAADNTIYGLFGMIIFTTIVTVGFVFELGKEALKITSKQYEEFPPDPYGFSSTQKLSKIFAAPEDIPAPFEGFILKPCMPALNPQIWLNLTEDMNIQAIEELIEYLGWAVNMFNESVIEYDFVMKPNPDYNPAIPDLSTVFKYSDVWGKLHNYIPSEDSPMWGDKLYSGRNGRFLWLSHYKNNNMGIPYTKFEYPLIKSVYINYNFGLTHTYAPVPSLTTNWTNVNDKIRFLNRGIHSVSAFFEIIRSTAQNINAHLKYGHFILEHWKGMDTHLFLNALGLEVDWTDPYWEPYRVDILSIMKKQGYDPENEAARAIIKDWGDRATPQQIKDLWIKFNTDMLNDLDAATKAKCELINKSTVLSELARVKMDQYNHTYTNWPNNPPVERMIEFTGPSPFYRSTIHNSVILPQSR